MQCEECKYYSMIDFDYGCWNRFPPLNKTEFKRKWLFLVPIQKIEYTTVTWCQKACGEFKQNSTSKAEGEKK